MEKKKVGLITYYGNNYGGCLQAYALQQVVKDLGYDPSILQVDTPLIGERYNRWTAISRVLKAPLAFLARRKYIKADAKNNINRVQAFDRYRNEYLKFDKSFILSADNQTGAEAYDIFVCGSDQIWNPNLYGVHPIWTMKFVPTNSKKIAYAPSLGVSSLPDRYIDGFKESLKDYTFLSCREQEGADILSQILDKNVDVVLDPTLLLPPEQWHAFALPVDIRKPYVFCYLFGDYQYIYEVKQRVKEYFNYDLVCLPYNLRELRSSDIKLYDIIPNQFVWLIENAEFVVTDSFHASVFSIKMSTPFVSLKRTSDKDKKNMNSRLYTLLKTVGLEDRMLDESMVENIVDIIESKIDFDEANNRLSECIKRDLYKLENALTHE